MSSTTASKPPTQAWVFGHRLLPKAVFTGQRRFLAKLRGPAARDVLGGIWTLAGRDHPDATADVPDALRVTHDERIGHLDFVVVALPPPPAEGTHFVGLIFSEYEGTHAADVDAGTEVLTWGSDGRGAMMRFIGAAGFVPATPGDPAPLASGGSLGFFDDDLGLDAFVRAVHQRYARPSLLTRVKNWFSS